MVAKEREMTTISREMELKDAELRSMRQVGSLLVTNRPLLMTNYG
jgi:hypothetical protein